MPVLGPVLRALNVHSRLEAAAFTAATRAGDHDIDRSIDELEAPRGF